MSEGSGSTAGDDTSSNRPIGDANKETNRDTSGTTEEESSGVLTPSVDTTAQGAMGIVTEISNGGSSNGGGNGGGGSEESNNEEENTNGDSNGDTSGDTSSNGDTNGATGGDSSGNTVEETASPPPDDTTTPQVNTDTTEETMPDTTTSGDQLEAKPEVTAQSSGSDMDHSTTQLQNEVSPSDIWYTGIMYHVKKEEVGHWKTIYSVFRDLEDLKKYINAQHPNAEPGDVVTVFKFVQPNGVLQLHLQTPQQTLQQLGWSITPERKPMKIFQSTVDEYPSNPLYSSCSISVYAEPGVAKKPLHCPIKLTGIDPETTIYINLLPPPPPSSNIDNTTSTSSTTGASQTSRETEESTFRPDVAYRVMTENIALIKSAKVDLHFLADKLLEKEIIDTDEHSGHTADQRMDRLLELLTASIRLDGEYFSIFLEILREKDHYLAKKLLDAYVKIGGVDKQVSINEDDLDEWFKEGEVDITVTRINMHGPPGSGKTCSQLLLLNQDPPAEVVTDSTPIACRAVKATRTFVGHGCLEEVDGNALLVRLASNLETHKKDKLVAQHAGNTAVSFQDTSMVHNDGPSMEVSSLDTSAGDSPDEIETTTKSDPDVKEVCRKIIIAIQKGNAKSLKLDRHLVYIVDSGGQPACQELLPLFTRPASFNIITIDLSKGINETLEYQYRICKNSFCCDQNSTFTNEKFLRDSLSSAGAIHSTPSVSKDTAENAQCPNYLVLGTHEDIAPQKNKDALNKVLSSLSDSDSKEKGYNLISAKKGGSKEIIFPINTLLEKGSARDKAAENLCNIILSNSADEKISVPIRLFAFELVLENKAAKKGCVLEIDEAMAAGRSLEMKEDDTIKALKNLHDHTLILYYPEFLPEIVFTDPHPILDLLTRLLALTYKIDDKFLRDYIVKKLPLQDELDDLEKNGIFKELLLSKLRNDEDQIFKNSNFIQLLLHLHIIAQTKNGYFIPCALKSCNCPPPKVKLKPLLIVQCKPPEPQTLFVPKILPVPHGVFPKMIVHLMNCEEPRFLIPDSSSKGYKYRNAMSLCIFCHSDKSSHGEQIGTICIIKKYKHIEVYFIGDPKHCPLVRKEVINAFISSSPNTPYFVPAFMCPSKDVNCYCIITDGEEEKFNCTSCPMPATIEDGEKYLYWSWFRDPHQSSSEVSNKHRTLEIPPLSDVRQSLREAQFRESQWLDLGDQLGLHPNTLDVIENNHRNDTRRCLREILVKWLEGADGVSATWSKLVKAIEDIGQQAVAEHIRCKWIKRKS